MRVGSCSHLHTHQHYVRPSLDMFFRTNLSTYGRRKIEVAYNMIIWMGYRRFRTF